MTDMAKFIEILKEIEKKEKPLDKEFRVQSLDKRAEMIQRIEPRITGKEFLKLYRIDGTVWGRINKYVKKIVGPSLTIVPDPNAPPELLEVAKQEAIELNKWSKQVNLSRILRIIVKDAFLYGRGFVELCKNMLGTDIIYLHTIDPLKMDYMRDKLTNKPILDKYGRPIKYIFKDEIKEIELDVEEVGHFKFFELSELDLGQSPLEPLYNVIVSKANFEKAAGEVLFRKGFPLWVLYVGDKEHPPTAEAMNYAEKEFKDIDRVTELIFPFYYKLDKIEASKIEELREYHEMFKNVINEGFLITPRPRVRRRQVETADIEEESIVKSFQQELADQVMDQIIRRVVKIRKYKTTPTVVFQEIKPATLLTLSRMIAVLFRYGVLTHDLDTENWVRTMIKMPSKVLETEFKKNSE